MKLAAGHAESPGVEGDRFRKGLADQGVRNAVETCPGFVEAVAAHERQNLISPAGISLGIRSAALTSQLNCEVVVVHADNIGFPGRSVKRL